MTDDELGEPARSREPRERRRVTLEDATFGQEIFATGMGEDVEARRNFIQQNAKDVRFLDI